MVSLIICPCPGMLECICISIIPIREIAVCRCVAYKRVQSPRRVRSKSLLVACARKGRKGKIRETRKERSRLDEEEKRRGEKEGRRKKSEHI